MAEQKGPAAMQPGPFSRAGKELGRTRLKIRPATITPPHPILTVRVAEDDQNRDKL